MEQYPRCDQKGVSCFQLKQPVSKTAHQVRSKTRRKTVFLPFSPARMHGVISTICTPKIKMNQYRILQSERLRGNNEKCGVSNSVKAL